MKLRLWHVCGAIALLAGLVWGFSAVGQLTTGGPVVASVAQSGAATLAAYPANPGRRALTICTVTNAAHITFGAAPTPTTTVGFALASGTCANFPPIGLTPSGGVGGQVNVISDAGTANITFIEY